MATKTVSGVRLAGVSSAVPSQSHEVAELTSVFGEDDVRKIIKSAGVRARRISPPNVCTSDLCGAAAEGLLDALGWERDSIDALIFVSQTPDYVLPATSCVLHGTLGLAASCAAFDLNLGCSGYPYGLWLASEILRGSFRRILLLTGDTITKLAAPRDRSVALLFGDAGTATALEADPDAPDMHFEMGTDGTGKDHLIVPGGGFRTPHTAALAEATEREGGNIRSDENLYMNGGEIFGFTLNRVPPLVEAILKNSGWTRESADAFVFHQANRFMLQHLGKAMKLPADKMVLGLEEFGNTSSASIPLALTTGLRERLSSSTMRLVLAGFGVGFSWAGAAITAGPMVMPQLIEYSGKAEPETVLA
jgi:3-oxoacyl-[acyl-carrier-protein] synthase III